jgi:hypothetical protein
LTHVGKPNIFNPSGISLRIYQNFSDMLFRCLMNRNVFFPEIEKIKECLDDLEGEFFYENFKIYQSILIHFFKQKCIEEKMIELSQEKSKSKGVEFISDSAYVLIFLKDGDIETVKEKLKKMKKDYYDQ